MVASSISQWVQLYGLVSRRSPAMAIICLLALYLLNTVVLIVTVVQTIYPLRELSCPIIKPPFLFLALF